MKRAKQKSMWCAVAAPAAVAMALAGGQNAAAQDAFVKYYNSSLPIGGFSPVGSRLFYQANFGTPGFTRWQNNAGTWSGTELIGETDMRTFAQSITLSGNTGLPPGTTASGGSTTIGDIVLNPAPLTITRNGLPMTYPVGTLGVVVDSPSNVVHNGVTQWQHSKVVWFYDLRQVAYANDEPIIPSGSGLDRDDNGFNDWFDVFEPLISKGDLRTVAGYAGTTTSNTSRHFAFSSNGQSIYFVDSSNTSVTGGLWKKNLTTPGTTGLTRILTGTTSFNTEPSVVASTVRAFGALTGDQIVVTGAAFATNSNPGGVSYVVDNGTTVSVPQTLLTAKQIQWFLESTSTPSANATAADASGNLYVFNGAEDGVYRYDTAGRLSKVFSRAEQVAFETTGGGGTSSVATISDMKVRDVTYTGNSGSFPIKQLLYSSAGTVRAPLGVYLFQPGDFDRDNDVDTADIDSFKAQLNLRGVSVASAQPSSPFGVTNAAAMKYDLNGSLASAGQTHVAIDWKDVKILQQFTGLSSGDADMDFDVDYIDLDTVAANYNGANDKLFTQGNLTSVRIAAADKDTVNYADLVTIAANWDELPKPTAAELSARGYSPAFIADATKAFGVGGSGLPHRYVAKGNGAWSMAANWTNGVPNGVDQQAHLLTDPTNDVNLTVDGDYTIGQVNFDHYFSYALSGPGKLTMQSSVGNAQINAFAASPTIAAGLELASDTDINVAYASDTLTISGPLTAAGAGAIINKLGPGTLTITGAQTHATGVVLNAVAGTTNFNSDGGSNLGIHVSSAVNFKVSQNVGSVEIDNGGTAAIDAGGTRVLKTEQLPIAGSGKLDVRDNKLIVTGESLGEWNGSDYTGVTGYIKDARNGGAWNGGGITTSLAAAENGLTTLAVAAAGDVEKTTVGGVTVDESDVLVMYTYNGDADLTGDINGDDFWRIDQGYLSRNNPEPLLGFANGDFDYSGRIDADDYFIIDRNYNRQGAAFGGGAVAEGVAAVPEPTGLVLTALAGATSLRRRRNRSIAAS